MVDIQNCFHVILESDRGETCYLFLFVVYLNDAEEFMHINNVKGFLNYVKNLKIS